MTITSMASIGAAVALRRAMPTLRVLIVSGYAEGEGLDPAIARLAKPFRRSEPAESIAAT